MHAKERQAPPIGTTNQQLRLRSSRQHRKRITPYLAYKVTLVSPLRLARQPSTGAPLLVGFGRDDGAKDWRDEPDG